MRSRRNHTPQKLSQGDKPKAVLSNGCESDDRNDQRHFVQRTPEGLFPTMTLDTQSSKAEQFSNPCGKEDKGERSQ